MVGFSMLYQSARKILFPVTRKSGIGTLLMFAVRSIFADPPRIAREMRELAAKGRVEKWLGETDDPLGFLVHEGGAASMIEAAYRFVAPRARRRRGAVRHRRRRASAQQHRGAAQAAVAGGGSPQARDAVRSSHRRWAGFGSGAGAVEVRHSASAVLPLNSTGPVGRPVGEPVAGSSVISNS